MSRALASALAAVARMKDDSEVSAADLKKVLAEALGRRWDEDDDADDRAGRCH